METLWIRPPTPWHLIRVQLVWEDLEIKCNGDRNEKGKNMYQGWFERGDIYSQCMVVKHEVERGKEEPLAPLEKRIYTKTL